MTDSLSLPVDSDSEQQNRLTDKRARGGAGGGRGVSVTERRGRRGRSGGNAGWWWRRFPSGGRVRREQGATMCPVGRRGRGFSGSRP